MTKISKSLSVIDETPVIFYFTIFGKTEQYHILHSARSGQPSDGSLRALIFLRLEVFDGK